MRSNQIAAKVQKLAALAQALRAGEHFNITRLTVLKSLCTDPLVTARLGLCLARKISGTTPERFRPLIRQAVRQVTAHLERPTTRPAEAIWNVLSALQASQNEIEHHRWTNVRIIHSRHALLVEYTLKCILQPQHSSHYKMGAICAERYNPRYGTGLIPESAAAVQDLHRFWARHLRVMASSTT